METTTSVPLPDFLPGSSLVIIMEVDAQPRPFKLFQDVTERLEWRLARLYRDVCFLFGQQDSQTKGYVFAEAGWFCKKYDCDAATLRRWIKLLVEHGWLLSVGRGPQRRLIPLVHPAKIPLFFARFARLFKGVLRGFWGRFITLTEREENSNSKSRQQEAGKGKQESEPIADPHALAAAHSLCSGGISSLKQALQLVRDFGVDCCLEQLDALKYRKADNPGAMLTTSLRDKWPLPTGLISAREAEKRAEARHLQAAEERAAKERAKLAQEEKKAAQKVAEEAARQEFEQSIPEPLRAPWRAVVDALKHPMLRQCRPLSADDRHVVVSAPNEPGQKFVRERLIAQLVSAWRDVTGQSVTLEVVTT